MAIDSSASVCSSALECALSSRLVVSLAFAPDEMLVAVAEAPFEAAVFAAVALVPKPTGTSRAPDVERGPEEDELRTLDEREEDEAHADAEAPEPLTSDPPPIPVESAANAMKTRPAFTFITTHTHTRTQFCIN